MADILQLTNLSTAYMQSFLLTITRVSAFLVTSPVFGSRNIPAIVKIALAVLLSVILLPLNTPGLSLISDDIPGLGLALGRELILGAIIGFSSTLMFTAMQMAAHFIGLQMGLAVANVMDPVGQNSVSVLDQMYSVFAMLLFFAIDGHHLLIMAIQQTFEIIPLDTFVFSSMMADRIVVLTSQLWVISAKLALPVLAALLLADVALGIIARVVPQLNVFFVGLPLKIGLGLMTMLLALPMTLHIFGQLIGGTINDVMLLLGTGG